MLKNSFSAILFFVFNCCAFSQLDTTVVLKEVLIKQEVKFEQEVSLSGSSSNLSDVLKDRSPIFVKDYGAGNLSTVTYQGTTASQSSLYWNDININPISLGTVDYSLIDSYLFDELVLTTSENSNQGSGIGANLTLNSTDNHADGIKVGGMLKVGSFHDLNTGLKISYSDSLNSLSATVYGGKEKNDFKYFNPISQEFENQTNNQNDHLATLINYRRFLKEGLFYAKTWNRISDREIPSPVHVQDQEETQQDAYSRNVIGYNRVFNKFWFKSQLGFLAERYRYENPTTNIIGTGNIVRTQTQMKIGNDGDKFSFEASVFGDNQRAVISGLNQKRNIIGGSWSSSYVLPKDFLIKTSLRKEFYVKEEGLPILWEAKIEKRIAKSMLYISHQKNGRKPTFNDLYWPQGGNPDLGSEVSHTSYVGVKNSKWFYINAEFFIGKISDLIIWLPEAESGLWTPQNESEIERKGVTVEVNKEFKFKGMLLKPNLVWAYVSSVNNEGNQLIYTPENQLKWSLSFKERHGVTVDYSGQWNSKSYVTRDLSSFLPSYTVSNLEVGKEWKIRNKTRTLKTTLESRNLFGYSYYIIPFRALPLRYLGFKIELL